MAQESAAGDREQRGYRCTPRPGAAVVRHGEAAATLIRNFGGISPSGFLAPQNPLIKGPEYRGDLERWSLRGSGHVRTSPYLVEAWRSAPTCSGVRYLLTDRREP